MPSIAVMDCPHDAIQAVVTPSQKNVLFGFEVTEERARCDLSPSRDLGDGDAFKPFFSIQAHGRIDERLAGPTLLGLSKPESGLARCSVNLHSCKYALAQLYELNREQSPTLESVARFDIRFRWLIVGIWIAGALAAPRLLPSLASLSQSNNAQFLPSSAPSQHAAALAAPFQTTNSGATAVIVASRSDAKLSATDDATIARVDQLVRGLAGVVTVLDQGVSSDGQAHKALVVTTSNGGNTGNPNLVNAIRASFVAAQPPPGLSFHLTGPLAQATDAAASSSQTGTNIRVFSVLFVIVLLFVVYRSVLAPLVTLLPAVLSLVLAGPLIAVAGHGGLPVSIATQTLLPVLLLGAGTDYGLFLVYRVR